MNEQHKRQIEQARAAAEKIAEQRRLRNENIQRLSSQPAPESPPEDEEEVAVVEEQPEESPPADETPVVEEKKPDWEHLYRTADGLLKQQGAEFRAAKAEAAKRAEEAEKRAAALEAEMAELRAQMETSRPVTSEDLRKYFTAEQIERLGEDECRELLVVQRSIAGEQSQVTRKTVQSAVDDMRNEITREREALHQMKVDSFFESVTNTVPNWREIDVTPEFNEWLSQTDEMSGKTRKELGIDARDSLDVKRFAAIYKSFIKSQAKPVANAPKRVLPNGTPPADTTTAEGRKPAPVTLEEIKAYKNKHARGYYLDRPKELERDRARILSAMPQRQARS